MSAFNMPPNPMQGRPSWKPESYPEPMDCLDPPCIAPLPCQFAGSCRHRRIDSARSYDVAISECRSRNIVPFKDKEERA